MIMKTNEELAEKIHKTGNPGRPAVSSVNSLTSKMSGFVEFQLQANIT